MLTERCGVRLFKRLLALLCAGSTQRLWWACRDDYFARLCKAAHFTTAAGEHDILLTVAEFLQNHAACDIITQWLASPSHCQSDAELIPTYAASVS